jgi:predicted nucleotidyltransferase
MAMPCAAAVLARRQPPACGSMLIAMADELQTVAHEALAERERVLRAHEAEIRSRGVRRLCLFGSMARGEAGPGSDVDLLADSESGAKFSLIDLVGLQYFLGDLLGCRVEIGTSLERARPRIRQRIERDALEVL